MATGKSPGPLWELERAVSLFELVELRSFQVGSGRPPGTRSHLWGSVVVLSRASFEAGLRRLHASLCEKPNCDFKNSPMDWAKMRDFADAHGVTLAAEIPPNLHLSLRTKPSSNSGQGTGYAVNGPVTEAEFADALAALSHVRTGYAHQDPRKLDKVPPALEGVLWVRKNDGEVWSVQKPHAYSVVRVCEALWRYLVYSAFGETAALVARSAPLQLLEDRPVSCRPSNEVITDLANGGTPLDRRDALALVREAELSLAHEHLGNFVVQTTFSGVVDDLCDPIAAVDA